MAKSCQKAILPEVGAVYAMPLADGRFGVCRVLQRREAVKKPRETAKVLVGACDWVGDAPLEVVNKRLRPILVLTHHAHRGVHALIWINDAVPEHFAPLGLLAPNESEAATQCYGYSGWLWLSHQVAAQWRWDHEQELVLREEAEKAAADAARALANRAEYEARDKRERDAMTLDGLRAETGLESWRGMVPAPKLKAVRAVLLATLDDLSALGDAPKLRPALRILRQCVWSLNALDSPRPFIDTTDREDLCELIDKMAYVIGIHNADNLAGRWRDW